jgi:hypothetical protein
MNWLSSAFTNRSAIIEAKWAMTRLPLPAFLSVLLALAMPAHSPAQTCSPIQECGDVDDSGSVASSDALRVLRKAVGQNLTLTCQCGEGTDTCSEDLAECLAQPECGNQILEAGEECEANDLDGASCGLVGFAGGTMRCSAGCLLDTDDCYEERFDTSGPTIIDRQTGLEWEKKEVGNGVQNLTNPHDADNLYTWADFLSVPNGSVFDDFLVRLNAPIGAGASAPGEGQEGIGPTMTGCYANHCDWRLPTVQEIATIMQGEFNNCASPCMFPEFAPGVEGYYWTLSTVTQNTNTAWRGDATEGGLAAHLKTQSSFARAVRGGN